MTVVGLAEAVEFNGSWRRRGESNPIKKKKVSTQIILFKSKVALATKG